MLLPQVPLSMKSTLTAKYVKHYVTAKPD